MATYYAVCDGIVTDVSGLPQCSTTWQSVAVDPALWSGLTMADADFVISSILTFWVICWAIGKLGRLIYR